MMEGNLYAAYITCIDLDDINIRSYYRFKDIKSSQFPDIAVSSNWFAAMRISAFTGKL